jgi:hypothetical protein
MPPRRESPHLVLFAVFILVACPRLSHSQSACIHSLVLNATVCYWDASNHSSIAAPAVVGLTVLPLLHPTREILFASINGGRLIPLSGGAAAIPVPPPDALQSCDDQCSVDGAAADGAQCCAVVIDIWLISKQSRTNTGCSLYFTVPFPAAPAAAAPIFKFHGEINAGLQVNPPRLPFIPSHAPHSSYTAHT